MAARHERKTPTVHLHIVPLSVTKSEVDACRQLLNDDELDRARRLRGDTLQSRWLVSRARLRQVLADHASITPMDISFRDGRNKKPELEGGRPGFHFNLSHSGDFALIAVSNSVEVGVDIEYERELSSWRALAERVCSHDEIEEIRAAAESERQHLFYRCWTRKEAIIKATGDGLSADLKRISVSVGDDAKVLAFPEGDVDDWYLYHLEPASDFVGALALRAPTAPVVLTHRE